MHIVVADTESLILWVASADHLFDRYVSIDTTYISFKEYSAIMSSTNVDVYLTDGCMFKRNEIEVNKPELKNAIEEQNNIHCEWIIWQKI